MLSSQLNLFTTQAATPAPVKAARKGVGRPKPAYVVAPSNDDYLSVCLTGVWIGSLRAMSGLLYCLYYPGERGVCGFGGPTQQSAAAELHRCYARDGKELPRG